MPRGPLDILKKVLGMHAQVVTKPSLATSGWKNILKIIFQIGDTWFGFLEMLENVLASVSILY